VGYTKYMNKLTFASLFGNETAIPASEMERVMDEISKIGLLTFKVTHHETGWIAQCDQVDGIMAYDTNPSPTDEEIQDGIREAILAAFCVQRESEVQPQSAFAYAAA
jgi:hypothetical protein